MEYNQWRFSNQRFFLQSVAPYEAAEDTHDVIGLALSAQPIDLERSGWNW